MQSRKGRFIEHVKDMALLWMPAIVFIIFTPMLFLGDRPNLLPVLVTGAFGFALLLAAKWRHFRSGSYKAFAFGALTKPEKVFYLSGYFFVFVAIYIGVAGQVAKSQL